MSDNNPMGVFNHPNVNDLLGVDVVSASPDEVVLRIEVGPNVHQPFGILHG